MRRGHAPVHRGKSGIDSMYAQEKPKRNPKASAPEAPGSQAAGRVGEKRGAGGGGAVSTAVEARASPRGSSRPGVAREDRGAARCGQGGAHATAAKGKAVAEQEQQAQRKAAEALLFEPRDRHSTPRRTYSARAQCGESPDPAADLLMDFAQA